MKKNWNGKFPNSHCPFNCEKRKFTIPSLQNSAYAYLTILLRGKYITKGGLKPVKHTKKRIEIENTIKYQEQEDKPNLDTIKPEVMLRIREKELISKLQKMYDLSHCKSVNEFLNTLLSNIAFKDTREDEIFEKLETIEDKTNAIYEKVKLHV